MSTLIVLFIALAFCHFILESIILPIYKKETQFEIVNLRNRLINLSIDDKSLNKIEITNLANVMAFTVNEFDNHNLIEFYLLKNKINKEDTAGVNDKLKYLQSIPAINSILNEYNKAVKKTFIINIGALAIYVLPVFLLVELIKLCKLPFIHFNLLTQEIKAIYILSKDNNKPYKIQSNQLSHIHISSNSYLVDSSAKYTADLV
jgi:hypothetical protein